MTRPALKVSSFTGVAVIGTGLSVHLHNGMLFTITLVVCAVLARIFWAPPPRHDVFG